MSFTNSAEIVLPLFYHRVAQSGLIITTSLVKINQINFCYYIMTTKVVIVTGLQRSQVYQRVSETKVYLQPVPSLPGASPAPGCFVP